MKAVGMFSQGISAFEAGKYTRNMEKVNAQNIQNAGVSERDRIRYQARLQMGQQLVDQGGSGFSIGTGTALEALHQSAINRELDFAMSRAKANAGMAEHLQKGRLAYQQGKSAMAGGILSGAAEIASEIAGGFGGAGASGGEISSPGVAGTGTFTPGFDPAALAAPASSLSYSGGWGF